MDNTIIASFNGDTFVRTSPLWQFDNGIQLQFTGISLPSAYEVHFAHSEDGEAITVVGTGDTVEIPNELLSTSEDIFAWVYIVGQNFGKTKYRVKIPVRAKAEATGTTPTPSQQNALDAAIALVNEAAEDLSEAQQGIPNAIEGALQEAKESGEFDGADGVSPTLSVSDITGGHRITITDASGTRSVDVLDGDPGAPGYSPTVTVTDIPGGHRVTITDVNGAHSFDVMDGQGGSGTVDDAFSTTSENPVQNKVITNAFNYASQQLTNLGFALDNKVDKVSGKGLSSNDFTDSDKDKLDDAASETWVQQQGFLTSVDLAPYRTEAQQDTIDDAQDTAIAAKYSKPSDGIPKTDLASDVQTSLGKADTALQQHQDISGKLDKFQGVAHANEFCVVGSDGNITTVAMTAWQGGSY